MTLLTLELADLEAMATADPGDPPDATIVAMVDFRRKIRSTIIYFARQLGAGVTFAIAGRPSFPDPDGGSAEPQEAMGWSQQVLVNPDAMLDAAFRIALYNNIDAAQATPQLVFALGVNPSTVQIDTGLRNALIPLLPLMTKGLAPGR